MMIISVSKRTDIPALYGDWFVRRLEEGFVYSVNPYNEKQVKNISLKKEDFTAFVFWSKNPQAFMKHLDKLDEYTYYFQYTLTPYGKDLEKHLPNKETLIETFISLSKKIGKEKVIWRYDPIILTDTYTMKKHIELFDEYCERLAPYTEKVIISFVDEYVKNKETFRALSIRELTVSEMHVLADAFSKIAKKHGLEIETCAEAIDLCAYGINKTKCIDDSLIARLSGKTVIYEKDPYQRDECLCMKAVDIGSYDTCVLGCQYCYAVKRKDVSLKNYKNHDVFGKTLIDVEIDEEISVAKKEPTLFDS
ncbi:MAG: DUF1848 domain-containing protein [Candidatus Izemoplasmataceae bacterium]